MLLKPPKVFFLPIISPKIIMLLEYWPNHFFIKNQDTREILLQGRCVGGLYPLPPSSSSSSCGRQAFGVQSSSH
jgi:hypothetical protein